MFLHCSIIAVQASLIQAFFLCCGSADFDAFSIKNGDFLFQGIFARFMNVGKRS